VLGVADSDSGALTRELARIVGARHVHAGPAAKPWTTDATASRGVRGRADAAVLPASSEEVAQVLAWCYSHDVPVVPRGGGTGYAGGAVPRDGGVVVALERLRRVRELSPLQWRMHVEAGLTTAHVARLARENGMLYAPDPGAAEQSQLGGNIATNAGGPHTFKYGVTGTWVSGLEVVIPPGEVITVGGPVRKDVSGYDLRALMAGSEGTLGIITAAWLRLLPAPEARLPVAAAFADARSGCEAVTTIMGSGLVPAAIEYLDGGALRAAADAFPVALPKGAGFLVIAEADGGAGEAQTLRAELIEALAPGALAVHAPDRSAGIDALWRWRGGVSLAVIARRGGKVSEDIAVPVDRLADAVEEVVEIARRHGLEGCSWGHAGDGNVHATFVVDRTEPEMRAADEAAEELFALALRLGGTISGEHGVGILKRDALERQFGPRVLELQASLRRAFDPKGLLNPGKKTPRTSRAP
jgi:glycolate oxidase subunit GlcD